MTCSGIGNINEGRRGKLLKNSGQTSPVTLIPDSTVQPHDLTLLIAAGIVGGLLFAIVLVLWGMMVSWS